MTTSTAENTSAPQSKTSTGRTEAMIDQKPAALTCEKHGPYEGTALILCGKSRTSPCPKCMEERREKEAAEEERRENAQRQFRIQQLLGRSGIPPRFQGRTFDNYRAETEGQKRAKRITEAYAERFEDRMRHGGGLVLCGKPGTGKTHLAAAIGNHVIETYSRAVAFMTVLQAVRIVKDTWRKGSEQTESQAIGSLIRPDLLILDEVGVQFGSDTEQMILFEIINGRYEHMRPTILLSNLMADELKEYIGVRTVDRMEEGGGAVLAFDWDSYRSRVHKDEALPTADLPEPEAGNPKRKFVC